MSVLQINPFTPLTIRPQFRAKPHSKSLTVFSQFDNSQSTKNQQQDLNLSVLRFTFGIPGLDESYLPRWIGYGFGSLLLLNHFLGSNSATSPPQLRTEALGLSLAAFSIALPYVGRFLEVQFRQVYWAERLSDKAQKSEGRETVWDKFMGGLDAFIMDWVFSFFESALYSGASQSEQADLPEGSEQIFLLSEGLSDSLKEDMAWASYVLLRNTKAIAVLICIQSELCVRGYWNTPQNLSKAQVVEWFEGEIENIGLVDLKDTLYFPQITEFGLWGMLPRGTRSMMVEPVMQTREQSANETDRTIGFILLASSSGYAFSDKDRAWIRAITNKFKGLPVPG